jgi:hypothetical protein
MRESFTKALQLYKELGEAKRAAEIRTDLGSPTEEGG